MEDPAQGEGGVTSENRGEFFPSLLSQRVGMCSGSVPESKK